MEEQHKTYEYYFAKEVSQSYSHADSPSDKVMINLGNQLSDKYFLYKKVGEHKFQNVISEEILTDELSEKVVAMEEFYDYAQEFPYAVTELEKVYDGPYYLGLHTNLLAQLHTKNQGELERHKSIQRRARIKSIFQRRR